MQMPDALHDTQQTASHFHISHFSSHTFSFPRLGGEDMCTVHFSVWDTMYHSWITIEISVTKVNFYFHTSPDWGTGRSLFCRAFSCRSHLDGFSCRLDINLKQTHTSLTLCINVCLGWSDHERMTLYTGAEGVKCILWCHYSHLLHVYNERHCVTNIKSTSDQCCQAHKYSTVTMVL